MGSKVTDVGLEKKQHELKKHAATIHCSNGLSLLQRKISNALLYHAYNELLLKEEHEINIKQLCRLIAYNGNNHAVIKEALKELLSTVIEWNVVNDTTGLEDWSASSILASVSLQGPTCLYAYSPRMKQLLHSPSMFGKINLFIQSRFKSSYGLALYENCIRYRGLPFTKWFEMELFRKLMGVPDDKYLIFRDFKRRVLDKSVEEVNTYSDLIIEPEVLKEGRQVTKVRFLLKERAKKTRLGASALATNTDNDLKTKLVTQFGLTVEQVEQVLTDYGKEFIDEKLAVIEATKNYQEGKVHNLAGYFISALKNNYQSAKTSPNRIEVKRFKENEEALQKKELQKSVLEIREQYAHYREEIIDAAISALGSAEKTDFMQRFYDYAAISIETILKLQRGKYTRETILTSPQIKGLLRQFALQEFGSLPHLTLEAFLAKLPEASRLMWESFQEMEKEEIAQQELAV